VHPIPDLKPVNNTYYGNFVTASIDLDANSIVADRKIGLEFKEIVTQTLRNDISGQSERVNIKNAEIYIRYSGPNYEEYQINPIGQGSYAVIKNAPRPAAGYTYSSQDKLEKIYRTKILTSPGSFIDKSC
jgi:hypothetical protein